MFYDILVRFDEVKRVYNTHSIFYLISSQREFLIIKNSGVREEYSYLTFFLKTQLQKITVEAHPVDEFSLTPLIFKTCTSPTDYFPLIYHFCLCPFLSVGGPAHTLRLFKTQRHAYLFSVIVYLGD